MHHKCTSTCTTPIGAICPNRWGILRENTRPNKRVLLYEHTHFCKKTCQKIRVGSHKQLVDVTQPPMAEHLVVQGVLPWSVKPQNVVSFGHSSCYIKIERRYKQTYKQSLNHRAASTGSALGNRQTPLTGDACTKSLNSTRQCIGAFCVLCACSRALVCVCVCVCGHAQPLLVTWSPGCFVFTQHFTLKVASVYSNMPSQKLHEEGHTEGSAS